MLLIAPDAGSQSVLPYCADLHNLNESPVDQKDRMKYFVFAITSQDFWGEHDDDGGGGCEKCVSRFAWSDG